MKNEGDKNNITIEIIVADMNIQLNCFETYWQK